VLPAADPGSIDLSPRVHVLLVTAWILLAGGQLSIAKEIQNLFEKNSKVLF